MGALARATCPQTLAGLPEQHAACFGDFGVGPWVAIADRGEVSIKFCDGLYMIILRSTS